MKKGGNHVGKKSKTIKGATLLVLIYAATRTVRKTIERVRHGKPQQD